MNNSYVTFYKVGKRRLTEAKISYLKLSTEIPNKIFHDILIAAIKQIDSEGFKSLIVCSSVFDIPKIIPGKAAIDFGLDIDGDIMEYAFEGILCYVGIPLIERGW